MRIALLLPPLLAACIGRETQPTSVEVRAYSAPRDGSDGDFVMLYEPWGGSSDARIAGVGSVQVLARIPGVTVACANLRCTRSGDGSTALFSRPAGVDHVEIVVEKAGYESVRFSVPFDRDNSYRRTLVLMKTAGTP